MRKMALAMALAHLVLLAAGASFAQGAAQAEGQAMGQGQMMGQEMAGRKKADFGMMQRMMGGEIVATNDGGVIVMMGNKLYKYDRDLNLKKEVEIKIKKEECPQK